MTDFDTSAPAPSATTYHTDRPSARTAAEREEHWQHWWLKFGQPYQTAVIDGGGQPWTADIDERKALFMRRYTRPAAPGGLAIPDIRGAA
jgi:hypothetical protein